MCTFRFVHRFATTAHATRSSPSITNRAEPYLRYLAKEVEMLHLGHGAGSIGVSQLHLGGGTPTFLSDEELS
jgi:coproporphyrinogen III oxidase-like Fe-S oxidoreductase